MQKIETKYKINGFKERVYDKILNKYINLGYRYVPSYYMRGMTKYLSMLNNKDLVGCEIGIGQGINSYIICKNLNIKKLYCIDSFNVDAQENIDNGISAKNKIKANKLLKNMNVQFVYGLSYEVIKDIPDNLDFIYINGYHNYSGVKRDIELYFPKVKYGGVCGGHDYCKYQYGIYKAVDEFVEHYNLELFLGTYDDWWIVKK